MSITVRLWTKRELELIKEGEKNHLITTFLNVKTFSEEMIKVYPYHLRRKYIATWNNEPSCIEFYATDNESAKWFLSQEYITMPDTLVEAYTEYRTIEL